MCYARFVCFVAVFLAGFEFAFIDFVGVVIAVLFALFWC